MEQEEKKDKKTLKQKIHDYFSSKSKKSLILGGIFMILLPIGAGVAAGLVISKFFVGKSADYSSINASALVDDTEALMNKYQQCKDQDLNYEDALKPYEMVNVAYNLYSSHSNSKSVTIGTALAAIVTQDIRGCSIHADNQYFEESISKSSIVGVASRSVMPVETRVDFYSGEPTSSETAAWGDTHLEYTPEEYSDIYGKTPKSPLIYIVSKQTVISSETKLTKTDSGYTIDLTLDPLKSVINYVKQMKNISNLADYPAFDSVKTTFFLNNDLLINKLHVEESYYAKTGAVGADIDASIDIKYEVDTGATIPTLNETINYGDYK